MKTLILLFFTMLSLNIHAQTYFEKPLARSISVDATATANRTVYGWKYGVRVGLDISGKWKMGYMRVQNAGASEAGQKLFSGAYFQRALNPNSKLVIAPTLKIGFYDGQFLAVQPTIEGNYKVNDNVHLLAGVGRVDGYPSFDLGFKLDLTRIK